MELHAPDVTITAELDRLGEEIAELSAHLDCATARLLDLIREFDARGGWNNGFRSCAAWLSWRIGLAPGAAREHVRVARALGTLPRLSRALARGELSYSEGPRAHACGHARHRGAIAGCSAVPARPSTSSGSSAVGVTWTARPRNVTRPDDTRTARCTCIQTGPRYREGTWSTNSRDGSPAGESVGRRPGSSISTPTRSVARSPTHRRWSSGRRMLWSCSPRRLCVMSSIRALRASGTRSSSTSMPKSWKT